MICDPRVKRLSVVSVRKQKIPDLYLLGPCSSLGADSGASGLFIKEKDLCK